DDLRGIGELLGQSESSKLAGKTPPVDVPVAGVDGVVTVTVPVQTSAVR
ncbi:MAG: hypothetical protein JWQ11_1886, partial [Rhizobacter sp.]|nr:hypothetical protein [Rhizobacter sp.]